MGATQLTEKNSENFAPFLGKCIAFSPDHMILHENLTFRVIFGPQHREPLSTRELNQAFRRLDKNNSGGIDWGEFVTFWTEDDNIQIIR